jgi:hypothetical protein
MLGERTPVSARFRNVSKFSGDERLLNAQTGLPDGINRPAYILVWVQMSTMLLSAEYSRLAVLQYGPANFECCPAGRERIRVG